MQDKSLTKKFIGTWKIDPSDTDSIKEFGNVTMTFKDTGELHYLIEEDKKYSEIFLKYEILDNETLITEQISTSRIEKTKFKFDELGQLLLTFETSPSRFIKC